MYIADIEIEKQEIVRRYRNLLKVWNSKNKDARKLVRKAFDFAVDAHSDMRRKSGEPYVFHPIEVATIVAGEIGLGTTSIISALLHDVVEDTEYTLEDMRQLFGERVEHIIDGLTKLEEVMDRPSQQAENFRKILLTLSEDVRVILIKLADRLHNMRTLDALPKDKQLKISSETLFLFAPLAHRLGLFAIKSELEDLALKYTEPEVYFSIQQQLAETKVERTKFINRFIYPIKQDLSTKGIKFTIQARQKSLFSIWNKMKIKEVPLEEVYDLFAVRIVIDVPPDDEKSECWRVYSIITDHYRPNHNRLRDWISIPKANGYEALHTTVMSQSGQWVEVQIRSVRMDEIAEKGYAAHWKYKDSSDSDTGLEEWLNKIRDLIRDNDSDALEFVHDFKLNLFSDEIYVYTPKGDVMTLPAGSTVLDFAYAIHTDIGNTCIGAKVNYGLVPLNHVLKNVDQVEILTSDKQTPKAEWLNQIVTAKARSRIKQALKDERKKLAAAGKIKLEDLFKQQGVETDKATVQKFQEFLRMNSLADLFLMVANGDITATDVKDFSHEGERTNWFSYLSRPFARGRSASAKTLTQTIVEKLKDKPESLLLGDEMSDITYTVAICCSPIPGDDVVGFINDSGNIEIHRTNCSEAINLMSHYGNRIVKAKWKYRESISFLTGISIKGIDKKGLIRRITEIISGDFNINIRSFHVDTSEGMTEGTILFYVHDSETLKKVTDNLKKINEIIKVSRLDRLNG
jgi:GTP diphosphokinase / guanosine-3',5'-bis(diphosphate) 3'-diphosphatase